jgi:hypothetical protein
MTKESAFSLQAGEKAYRFNQKEIQIIGLALKMYERNLLSNVKEARYIGFDNEADVFAARYMEVGALLFSIENQERNL